ncbi:hypothetical protein [Ktedonosporobacter rubrisoli]|nr:hypothetical protein [Ktedonosporobacter rubrisoli]
MLVTALIGLLIMFLFPSVPREPSTPQEIQGEAHKPIPAKTGH